MTDAADTATVARLRKRIKKLKRKLKHYRKLEAAKAPPISELLTAEIIPFEAGKPRPWRLCKKLPRVFTRACFVRFCEASERSESKKSRKILLCSIVYKISPSFYTG